VAAEDEVVVVEKLELPLGGATTTVGKGKDVWRAKAVLRTVLGEVRGEVRRVDLRRDMAMGEEES